jgi:hypothetical protein
MMTRCITEKQITGAIKADIEPKIIAAPDAMITYARYNGLREREYKPVVISVDGTPPGSDDVCFDLSIERVYKARPRPAATTTHPIRLRGDGMISVIGRIRSKKYANRIEPIRVASGIEL